MGICENRTVIITGAARGLGRAYALAFGAEGANVVVNDIGTSLGGEGRDTSAADAVVAEIKSAGGQALANYEDITDWDAAKRIVDAAIAAFGDLHVVVNNAGIVRDRMFVSATLEEWDATMHVHLRGHFCLSRHAVDYWRAKQKAGSQSRCADHQHLVAARGFRAHRAGRLFDRQGRDCGADSGPGGGAWPLWDHRQCARPLGPHADDRSRPLPTRWRQWTAGFDAMDPANIAPTVVWLGSAESARCYWLRVRAGGREDHA